ncbi:MAG: hypothetical protein WAW37_13855 [Syntrophobacteraceae bacterium]
MSRRGLLPLSVAVLVLAFLLSAGLGFPGAVRAEWKGAGSSGHQKWAVILSPGPKKGVSWGGYHVTITGYDEKNGGQGKAESLRRAFKSLFHGQPWHLHGNLPALANWKGAWTQTFDSRTLDDLADRLAAEGFERIKGPRRVHTPWHISLRGDSAASKKLVEAFKRQKTNWYLWLVPEPDAACRDQGTGCPHWKRID